MRDFPDDQDLSSIVQAEAVTGNGSFYVKFKLPTRRKGETVESLLKSNITFFLGIVERQLLKKVVATLNEGLRLPLEKLGAEQHRKLDKAPLFGYYLTFTYKLKASAATSARNNELPSDELVALVATVLSHFSISLKHVSVHEGGGVTEAYFA